MRRPFVSALVWLAACQAPAEDAFAPASQAAGPHDPTSGTPPGSAPVCGAAVAVEPGVGLMAYTPLAEGDPVHVVTGPQATWHVDIAGSVTGTVSEAVYVEAHVYWPRADEFLSPSDDNVVAVALVGYDEAACSGVFYGARALIAPEFDLGTTPSQFICGLMGEALDLTVIVTDLHTGAYTEVTTPVVARPDATTDCT